MKRPRGLIVGELSPTRRVLLIDALEKPHQSIQRNGAPEGSGLTGGTLSYGGRKRGCRSRRGCSEGRHPLRQGAEPPSLGSRTGAATDHPAPGRRLHRRHEDSRSLPSPGRSTVGPHEQRRADLGALRGRLKPNEAGPPRRRRRTWLRPRSKEAQGRRAVGHRPGAGSGAALRVGEGQSASFAVQGKAGATARASRRATSAGDGNGGGPRQSHKGAAEDRGPDPARAELALESVETLVSRRKGCPMASALGVIGRESTCVLFVPRGPAPEAIRESAARPSGGPGAFIPQAG